MRFNTTSILIDILEVFSSALLKVATCQFANSQKLLDIPLVQHSHIFCLIKQSHIICILVVDLVAIFWVLVFPFCIIH